ncbi:MULTISPECIES: hypothetical protein [Salinivibrio]|jgi:hypothetical protein|uniref:Uncharacterized protein n=2 Tax=Salinivibrio TaxID=51366 RepID=A0ABY7LI52_9GAMM|nr:MULTISPECIES: hypothetical protein [Salinivibrio]ODQ01589.1 hypothetical protein BGK46_16410 [Salinivibrio sp. DV]OOF10823.1 hypothetical protein BZG82_06160 [Salinivibrio sp. PR5]OOF15373.1 hypothetical protein BZG83_03350 [Salinivibrio sp. PR919]OOF19266.1 hypothetical protein BZG84_01330 [Salinivibrio sp. PR932]OOF24198.1 hypothetical protein BZJ17_00860 [Salinivibrio sp. IB574]
MDLKVGRSTLLDTDAVEYQWIRMMASEGCTRNTINTSIQRCLGGDETTADILRRVAMKQCSVNELLSSLDAVKY